MYEFMYFAVGILAYRIISTVINYGHLTDHVKLVNEQSLRVLGTVTEEAHEPRTNMSRESYFAGVHAGNNVNLNTPIEHQQQDTIQ